MFHLLHTKPNLEQSNVVFDEEAEIKKKEIWGEDYKTTCAWTGKRGFPTKSGKLTKGLSRDHIYPIRGAYGNSKQSKSGWMNGGLRGSDSQWNDVFVFKQHNSGFKVFDHSNTHGWKKDISWQTLTQKEFEQCTDQERRLYLKIKQWFAYVISRGAHYNWKFTRETNETIELLYTNIYQLLEKSLDYIQIKLED